MTRSLDGAQAASQIVKHLNEGEFSTVDEVVEENPELEAGRKYLEDALEKPPVSGSILKSRY